MRIRIPSVRLLPSVYAAGKTASTGVLRLPVRVNGSVLSLNPVRTSVRSLSMDCVSPLLKVNNMSNVCTSPMMPNSRRSASILSPFRVNAGAVLTASP